MATQEIPSQQRISKSTGRIMIGIGIFFDFISLLLILVMFISILVLMNGSSSNTSAQMKAQSEKVKSSVSGTDFRSNRDLKNISNEADSTYVKAEGLIMLGISLLFGGAAVIFAGPIIYTIGSFFATLIAYMIFTVWFFLKGVNMWSFSSTERVLVNMSTLIIEALPLVNILPGITFMVWRHIKVSRVEDTVKENELLNKVTKATNKLAYA